MSNVGTIVKRHFSNVEQVPTSGIIFSQEVREMCKQNTCGFYNRNWTCPPAVEPLDDLRKKISQFKEALIIYSVYTIQSSFDWHGMKNGAIDFKGRLLALKKDLEAADSDIKFLLLGMGACHLCDSCTYVEGEPCRNPDDAIVSLEACGIDVMRLAKDNDMKYYNGKNTVTYFGGLFF